MRMKMKYIRFDMKGLSAFVIFPELLMHDEMAKCVLAHRPMLKVHSAGFIEGHYLDFAKCMGESQSLHITSDPEDTAELRKQFGSVLEHHHGQY